MWHSLGPQRRSTALCRLPQARLLPVPSTLARRRGVQALLEPTAAPPEDLIPVAKRKGTGLRTQNRRFESCRGYQCRDADDVVRYVLWSSTTAVQTAGSVSTIRCCGGVLRDPRRFGIGGSSRSTIPTPGSRSRRGRLRQPVPVRPMCAGLPPIGPEARPVGVGPLSHVSGRRQATDELLDGEALAAAVDHMRRSRLQSKRAQPWHACHGGCGRSLKHKDVCSPCQKALDQVIEWTSRLPVQEYWQEEMRRYFGRP